ncbi:TPA: hypothetical protein ENX78_10880 [Candidatus Poribacteria bacterium]|nr:hypothetical protein [Candidatus Poribacteria bacterium]
MPTISEYSQKAIEKHIKGRRELLALYVSIKENTWRRLYPESFYQLDGFIAKDGERYAGLIYDIFEIIVAGSKKELIEDELNLIYMDIEYKARYDPISKAITSTIQERLELKKQFFADISAISNEIEANFPERSITLIPLRFRLESTTYLVRLLAYGLFSDNNMMFDRIAEVFDIQKLQSATKPEDKHDLDNALKFLYKGLIQKTDSGRQGSRHAAKQTLGKLREWYPDNEYVNWCIDIIEKYV